MFEFQQVQTHDLSKDTAPNQRSNDKAPAAHGVDLPTEILSQLTRSETPLVDQLARLQTEDPEMFREVLRSLALTQGNAFVNRVIERLNPAQAQAAPNSERTRLARRSFHTASSPDTRGLFDSIFGPADEGQQKPSLTTQLNDVSGGQPSDASKREADEAAAPSAPSLSEVLIQTDPAPLPQRAYLEQALCRDLSNVKAYQGPAVDVLLSHHNANAAAIGSCVLLGPSPSLAEIAEEVIHTCQQTPLTNEDLKRVDNLPSSNSSDPSEREATKLTQRVLSGQRVEEIHERRAPHFARNTAPADAASPGVWSARILLVTRFEKQWGVVVEIPASFQSMGECLAKNPQENKLFEVIIKGHKLEDMALDTRPSGARVISGTLPTKTMKQDIEQPIDLDNATRAYITTENNTCGGQVVEDGTDPLPQPSKIYQWDQLLFPYEEVDGALEGHIIMPKIREADSKNWFNGQLKVFLLGVEGQMIDSASARYRFQGLLPQDLDGLVGPKVQVFAIQSSIDSALGDEAKPVRIEPIGGAEVSDGVNPWGGDALALVSKMSKDAEIKTLKEQNQALAMQAAAKPQAKPKQTPLALDARWSQINCRLNTLDATLDHQSAHYSTFGLSGLLQQMKNTQDSPDPAILDRVEQRIDEIYQETKQNESVQACGGPVRQPNFRIIKLAWKDMLSMNTSVQENSKHKRNSHIWKEGADDHAMCYVRGTSPMFDFVISYTGDPDQFEVISQLEGSGQRAEMTCQGRDGTIQGQGMLAPLPQSLNSPGQSEFNLNWMVNDVSAGTSPNHLLYRLPNQPLVSDVATLAVDKVTGYISKNKQTHEMNICSGIFDEKFPYNSQARIIREPGNLWGMYLNRGGYVCSTFANLYANLCWIAGINAGVKIFYGGFKDKRDRSFTAMEDQMSGNNMKAGLFKFKYHATATVNNKIYDPLLGLEGKDHMSSIYDCDLYFVDSVLSENRISFQPDHLLVTGPIARNKSKIRLMDREEPKLRPTDGMVISRGVAMNYAEQKSDGSYTCDPFVWGIPNDNPQALYPPEFNLDPKSGSISCKPSNQKYVVNVLGFTDVYAAEATSPDRISGIPHKIILNPSGV